jgi:hypothetical protein
VAIGLLASAQMGVLAAVIALGLPAHTLDQAGLGDLLRRTGHDRGVRRRVRDPAPPRRGRAGAGPRSTAVERLATEPARPAPVSTHAGA